MSLKCLPALLGVYGENDVIQASDGVIVYV